MLSPEINTRSKLKIQFCTKKGPSPALQATQHLTAVNWAFVYLHIIVKIRVLMTTDYYCM